MAFPANDPDEAARDLSYAQDTNELKDASWEIFSRLVERHSVYGSGHYPRLEESECWSMGEKVLYGTAMVIAARSKLNVDLPLIFESPFFCLDVGYREGLADYLESMGGQQIMLMSPYQVDRRYDVDYELAAPDLNALREI